MICLVEIHTYTSPFKNKSIDACLIYREKISFGGHISTPAYENEHISLWSFLFESRDFYVSIFIIQ